MNQFFAPLFKKTWEIPITVEAIEKLTFNQIKANCIATTRRGYV